MNLAPHRSAVQHLGCHTVVGILASNPHPSDEDLAAAAARADRTIELSLHTTIMEAMIRHGHIIPGDDGSCKHENPTVWRDGQEGNIDVRLMGSMLQSGCMVLSSLTLAYIPGSEHRVKLCVDAGAFKAIAVAVRTNPKAVDFSTGPARFGRTPVNLLDLDFLHKLIGVFYVHAGPEGSDEWHLIDPEDLKTLAPVLTKYAMLLPELRTRGLSYEEVHRRVTGGLSEGSQS